MLDINLILNGNTLTEIPAAIDSLTEAEALKMVPLLKDGTDRFGFFLGGVLQVIKGNNWWKATHKSWLKYLDDTVDVGYRQAQYQMKTYRYLIDKQIPWDKVRKIDPTKLHCLTDAKVLTAENVDTEIAKYAPMTVKEIKNELKFASQPAKKEAPPKSSKTFSGAAPEPKKDPDVTMEQVKAFLDFIGEEEAVRLVKEMFPGSLWKVAA